MCNLDTSHEVQMDKNKEEEEEKKSEIENLHTDWLSGQEVEGLLESCKEEDRARKKRKIK